MKEKKIIGIYKITHKTGYFYIGCSLNIIKRWDSHLKMLEKNKHHCKDFQKIYNDSEINDFTFEILETINKKTTPKTFQEKNRLRQNLHRLEYKHFNKNSRMLALNACKKNFSKLPYKKNNQLFL